MSDPVQSVSALTDCARAALASVEDDRSNPGMVAAIGLRDVVRRLEQLQQGIAYEQGLSEGTVRRMWPGTG